MRDGELAYVDVLLVAWGLWSLRDSARLGYAHKSIVYRMMIEGAVGAAIKRLRTAEIPSTPAIELTEAALVAMPEPLRAAIKVRYLHLHWPSRACAQTLDIPTARFTRTLELAMWWLAGRLSA